MLPADRLEQLLAAFPRLTIALIGDLFLDRYLELEPGTHELSIETGLEAYQITRIRNSPGALGTVLNNLAALGVGLLVPITVIGDDGHGYDLLRELKRLPVDPSHVVRDAKRLTPTYTKPLRRDAQGHLVELNRLDVRDRRPLAEGTTAAAGERLATALTSADGLIVLDQINETDWGVVNSVIRARLVELASTHREKVIFVDSRTHLGSFEAGSLKGNRREVTAAAGLADDDSQAPLAVRRLADRTGRTAYCTCGERGIWVARPGAAPTLVPGCPVTGPIDIVGAGDSATAGIVASLLAGASPEEAAAVGNLVASITVQQLGTTGTASPAQVRERWLQISGARR